MLLGAFEQALLIQKCWLTYGQTAPNLPFRCFDICMRKIDFWTWTWEDSRGVRPISSYSSSSSSSGEHERNLGESGGVGPISRNSSSSSGGIWGSLGEWVPLRLGGLADPDAIMQGGENEGNAGKRQEGEHTHREHFFPNHDQRENGHVIIDRISKMRRAGKHFSLNLNAFM